MLERLRIDITRDALEVHDVWGFAAQTTLRSRHGLPAQDPLSGLAAAWAQAVQAGDAQRSVRIVLADDWLRFFMVEPPPNAQGPDDLRAAAGMRFEHLYGEPDLGWSIQARWRATKAFAACAAPLALLDAVQDAARQSRLSVRAIVPTMAVDWPDEAREGWVISWQGGTRLTLAAMRRGLPSELRTTAVPQGNLQDAAGMTTWLERQALLLGAPAPQNLYVRAPPEAWRHARLGSTTCHKTARAAWPARAWTEIDFAARSRTGWLRWLHWSWGGYMAFIFSSTLCSYAGTQLVEAANQKQAVQHERAELDAALAARPQAHAPTRSRASEAQMAAVNRAVHHLNLPWPAVLDALEAATPANVALLALEPDARERRLKVTAEAATPEAMLAYLNRLATRPALEAVRLVRHEVREQAPMQPVRFWFEAQWVEPTLEGSRQ